MKPKSQLVMLPNLTKHQVPVFFVVVSFGPMGEPVSVTGVMCVN